MEVNFQITILLCAALFGFVLARRFGQSAVIGEIFIGIVIGPSLLGLVAYTESVSILAELGAIFLLFTIGLECNYKHIYTVRNSFVALLGMVIPLVAGWWLAAAFGYSSIEAIFIGVALTATSIAITAQVLKERKLINKAFARTILGAAVVDDILSLLALGIVGGLSTEMNLASIGQQLLLAAGFVIGALIVRKPVNKLVRHIDKVAVGRRDTKVTIFAAMIVAFSYAATAHLIGLSSIVGAFIAGVTLEELRFPRVKEGAAYFDMLFSAIFFVSLGVLMDLTHMTSEAWIFAIILTVVAVLTKLFGCLFPARWTGHTWKESFAVGIGMVPRGEVAMIVGLIGLTGGIISQSTYGVIIFMAFITTVIAPFFLQWALPKKS
ncbi:MAG: cation:proton antiporter [Candidatus Woesearchaeota archaeon]|nr:cation:proton antiporter [Candidatus Woesearchaeota archaeon]